MSVVDTEFSDSTGKNNWRPYILARAGVYDLLEPESNASFAIVEPRYNSVTAKIRRGQRTYLSAYNQPSHPYCTAETSNETVDGQLHVAHKYCTRTGRMP